MSRIRILLADDSITIQKVVELTFSDGDYEVTAVNNGAKAVQKLAEMRPDIILSDIIMPGGISGLELARKVRDRFPELPILLTTGYSEQVGGVHGFPVLPKPYEMDSLVSAVRKLLKHELPPSGIATSPTA